MAQRLDWTVFLTGDDANRRKAYEIYGADHFPRRFHYKREAETFQRELTANKIDAEVV